MKRELKYGAAAVAIALAPASASALSFYGSVSPTNPYEIGSGTQNLIVKSIGGDPAGSFDFDVVNNLVSVHTYTFGVPYFGSGTVTPPATYEVGGTTFTEAGVPFSFAINSGDTQTVTVSYPAAADGDRVVGTLMSSVPLPAGLVLLLSALGLTGLVQSFRGRSTTA